MCEAITAIASTAATVFGGVKASSAARAQGREANRAARVNAQMAEYAALDAESRGRQQAAEVLRDANRVKGDQRAAAAANGVTAGYGTLAAASAQTDFFGALDAAQATDDASRDAYTARTQGAEALRAGRAAQSQANARSRGILLGTAADLAGKWYNARPATESPGSYSISGSARRG